MLRSRGPGQSDHPPTNRIQAPPRRLGADGRAFVNQMPVDVLQPQRDPQDVRRLLPQFRTVVEHQLFELSERPEPGPQRTIETIAPRR